MDLDELTIHPTANNSCASAEEIKECNEVHIGGLRVAVPAILPCCVLAFYVGLHCGIKIYKHKAENYIFYAITFVMVGLMMLDAGFNDSFLASIPFNDWHLFFTIYDIGLTSSIGVAFFFDALVDTKIIKQNCGSLTTFFLCVASLFVAWYYVITKGVPDGFFILYFGCVGIGCGTWVIAQIYLIFHRESFKGVIWLILGAAIGGFGYFAVSDPHINEYLCREFNCYFAGNFFWFLATPIAIYFIYRYVYAAQPKRQMILPQYGVPFFHSNPYHRGQAVNYLEMGHH